MGARERLVIEEHPEEKAAARCEVLQEPDGAQAQMPRGVAEPDQRQPGHHPGRNQDKRDARMRWTEDERAAAREQPQVNYAEGQEQSGLEKEAGDRRGPGYFAQ